MFFSVFYLSKKRTFNCSELVASHGGECISILLERCFSRILRFFVILFNLFWVCVCWRCAEGNQYFIIIDENEYSMNVPFISGKLWSMHTNVVVVKRTKCYAITYTDRRTHLSTMLPIFPGPMYPYICKQTSSHARHIEMPLPSTSASYSHSNSIKLYASSACRCSSTFYFQCAHASTPFWINPSILLFRKHFSICWNCE